ncbi:MAG: TonB-dependent receptor [Gammaproteobacteria bacterium]|nr:MAG: TonB-dependent receptor [Gammaproteobacteria bacterium]
MSIFRSNSLAYSSRTVSIANPFTRKLIATAVSLVVGTTLVSLNAFAAEKTEQESQKEKENAVKLEKVVVTSRNRAEAAQDVPLPVRVIGGERLDRDDVKSVWDLPSIAPNLQLNNPGENARKVSPGIRGLGRGGANDSMEQSVGTIVDGVTLYYSGQAWADYVDLDRIEVLYGPQGTLVGKNTSLGAIKIATKLPSFKPSSSVEITAGELNTLQAKVSTTGPLIDDLLAYRGTFLVDRRDGLYDNTYLNFGKSRETWRESNKIAGRIQFLLTPNEDFTGRFIFDKLRSDERTNTGSVLVSNGPETWADGTARAKTPPIDGTGYTATGSYADYGYLGKFAERSAWFHNSDGTVYQPPVGTTDIENSEARPQITNQYGASAQFDWSVANHTITSITAYRYQDFDIKNGGQFGQFYVSNSGQQLWNDQFSQELRIASDTEPGKFFDYQAGLYYLNAEVYSDDPSYYGADAGAWFAKSKQFKDLLAVPKEQRAAGRELLRASLDKVYQSSVTDATADSLAVYAQADFHFTEKATLSVGVRDTDETKKNKIATQLDRQGENLDVLGEQYGATAGQIAAAKAVRSGQVPIEPFSFVEGNDIDDNLIAWNISPSYKLTDDFNIYASVGKGVKSGFIYFNQYVAPTDPTFETDVKAEETLDYELGFKSLLLNRSLQLNVNLYDTKVTDYQASWTRTDPRNDGAFVTAWGNAPKVEAKGIELESNYRLTKELDFNLGAAYNEATYESEWLVLKPEVVANNNRNDFIDRNGKQIANVPKVVVNYGLNYQTPVAGYLGRITLQNTYKSGSYFNDNQSEFTYQKAYTVSNLSFALGSLNKKWEAQLNIRNVFDTEYAIRRTTFTSTAGQTIEIGAPRYTSLTLKYNL